MRFRVQVAVDEAHHLDGGVVAFHLAVHEFTEDVEFAVQVFGFQVVAVAEEELHHARLDAASGGSEVGVVGGYVAVAEQLEAQLVGGASDFGLALPELFFVLREEELREVPSLGSSTPRSARCWKYSSRKCPPRRRC